MKVKLIVEGGDMKPGPAIAQQLGPLGINLGKVIADVNSATLGFKGTKVPVEIDVNAKTKSFTIQVFSPPVAELIKKELKLEKASGEAGNIKVGNVAIEQVIGIAKSKLPNMLAKDLKRAVKLVTGSCVSLGVLIENKEAKETMKDIESGLYDQEISQEKIDVSAEKKSKLDKYFLEVKAKQDKMLKAREEAKAAEEAAKAAAALVPAAGTPATGTTGTAATPGTPATAAATPVKVEAKKEEKPAKKK